MSHQRNWYEVRNLEGLDSPALVVYQGRIENNIRLLKKIQPDTRLLRPHVKTNKTAAVQQLMIRAGIKQFKCATIAEAEMLAIAGAKDVLLAYQPVGPKLYRFAALMQRYPQVKFSCLVDQLQTAETIAGHFQKLKLTVPVWIDLNVGMDRTGILPAGAEQLFAFCLSLKALRVEGLHAYDGHLISNVVRERKRQSDMAFKPVKALQLMLQRKYGVSLQIVAGGTPTFAFHAKRKEVQCSPGTFIFWDAGYAGLFPELKFEHAAVLITRVISVPSGDKVCLDLGYKSIASEKPLPRVHFLNVPEATPFAQSEEHLVVTVPDSSVYKPGDIFYGIPVHICPTVALYDELAVVRQNKLYSRWPVTAAAGSINI